MGNLDCDCPAGDLQPQWQFPGILSIDLVGDWLIRFDLDPRCAKLLESGPPMMLPQKKRQEISQPPQDAASWEIAPIDPTILLRRLL
jgi:hypothetical protein